MEGKISQEVAYTILTRTKNGALILLGEKEKKEKKKTQIYNNWKN